MGLIADVRHQWDLSRLRSGSIRKEDAMANLLDKETGDFIVKGIKALRSYRYVNDPILSTQLIDDIHERLSSSVTRMQPGDQQKAMAIMGGGAGISGLGYEPTGSQLRSMYPNPFSPYAFVGENYWACVESRRQVRVEVSNDSYLFWTQSDTSKKKIRLVWDTLNDLNLLPNLANMVDHLNLYSNCWLLPIKNLFGGLLRYELLEPERMLPRWDTYKMHVTGWEYQDQGQRILFAPDELIHLQTYSARTKYLGAPTIAGMIVAVEACMYGDIYISNLLQNGGMQGNLIALKTNGKDGGALITEKNHSIISELVEDRMNRQPGVRGAGQNVISPWVEGVFPLSRPRDIDGVNKWYQDAVDRKLAILLCCNPESIGVPVKSQYEDKQSVANRGAEMSDNKIAYLANIVFDMYNQVISGIMGIDDVIVQGGGAYKAMVLNAGEFGKMMAAIGTSMTNDEFRKVLKMTPYGGDFGKTFLDNRPLASRTPGQEGVLGPELPMGQIRQTKGLTGSSYKGWVTHPVDEVKGYPRYNYFQPDDQD